MFALNPISFFPTSDQKIVKILPDELEKKICSFLPIKTLALSRLVFSIWKTFIDTHFTEVSNHQFVFILQNYPIADQNQTDFLSTFALKKIVANDFEKALEMEKKMSDQCWIGNGLHAFNDLATYADSKEKILKLFDFFLKREKMLDHHFSLSIPPLIKRYFSIHASLKKEKQGSIAENFNEALSLIKKFPNHPAIRLLIALSLVEIYPEQVKNQQNALVDSLKLRNDCFQYLEILRVIKEFSFSTFLNFLMIANFSFNEAYLVYYIFDRITNREEALTFLRMGGRDNMHHLILRQKIYQHLNFFDLLREVATWSLKEEVRYKFYETILRRAESTGEFAIGLQKFLEIKPKEEELKELLELTISIILEEARPDYLPFEIYEMLLDYHCSAPHLNRTT